jgi:Leucine Rich repeat
MCAWGGGGSSSRFSSCTDLLRRIADNDPTLTDLVILPMKKFGDDEINALAVAALETGHNDDKDDGTKTMYHWRTLSASGHAISLPALQRFGRAVSLSRRYTLVSLAIGHSNLGDNGVEALVNGLLLLGTTATTTTTVSSSSCPLERLDLSFKNLTRRGLSAVARLTAANPRLVTLNLERNVQLGTVYDDDNDTEPPQLCNGGNQILMDNHQMRAAFGHLQHLNVSECGWTASSCQSTLARLLDHTSFDTSVSYAALQSLSLNRNFLTDEGLRALQLATSCPQLQALHVEDCQLTNASLPHHIPQSDDESDDVVYWSAWPPPCRTLDLSHNDWTDEGVVAWAKTLPNQGVSTTTRHFSYQTMNVSHNAKLGDVGIQALLDICFASNTLEDKVSEPSEASVLDVSGTACGVASATVALQRAAMHGGLHTLRLGHNRHGGLGSRAAWTALAATLRDVYCTNPNNTAARVRMTAPRSPLHTLDLSGNGADEASVVTLLQAVLDVAQHDNELVSLPQCIIIGGNETGERVESLVRQIQQVRPSMDIARDKIKRTNAF